MSAHTETPSGESQAATRGAARNADGTQNEGAVDALVDADTEVDAPVEVVDATNVTGLGVVV